MSVKPGNISRKSLSKVLRKFVKNFERLQGDILIIDADSESVKDGDIALLLLDGNRAVRRLKHIDGGVWLIPSNNAFADEFIATEEMGRVCILGKVMERRRKY